MQTLGKLCLKELSKAPFRHTFKRSITLKADGYPEDFVFFHDFLSSSEQRILLTAALEKLDRSESLKWRRRRKELQNLQGRKPTISCNIQDVFLPDEYYCFEHVNVYPVYPEQCFHVQF